MKQKIIINGLFFSQKTTGVHRFAKELLAELDKLAEENEFEIVVPAKTLNVPKYNKLKVTCYGSHKGLLWEQLDYPLYLSKNHALGMSLCNSQPLLRPGIMAIHDVAYKTHPEYFKTLHGKLSVIWHDIVYKLAAMSKYPIITVSYFSKYSLIDTYKIAPSRINVISNGWQHILRIKPDDKVLGKHNLVSGNFYFTLGNINYNKNTKWVVDYAKKHPSETFVLSGIRVKNSSIDIDGVENLKFLGYLSDEEIVALYKHCKAFIFPSIHEGFGIPPMEALSQGAKIIVANTTCLPEIYRGAAYYIDAYDSDIDINALMKTEVGEASDVLNRYSWGNSAQQLKKLLDKYNQV